MKLPLPCLCISLLLGGCFSSQPATQRQMDGAWYLLPTGWEQATAPAAQGDAGPSSIPSRIILRHNGGEAFSAATRRADDGALEADISFSRRSATEAADQIHRVVQTLESLRRLRASPTARRVKLWASTTANALAIGEDAIRIAHARADGDKEHHADSALLRSALGYLSRHASAALPGDLAVQDIQAVRQAIASAVLRVAFAAAQKDVPPAVLRDVLALMSQAPAADQALVERLEGLLGGGLDDAPDAGPQSAALVKAVDSTLSAGVRILATFEAILRQWDKIDRIVIEVRKHKAGSLTAVTLHITPGQCINLSSIFGIQPKIIFGGRCRIVVSTDPAPGVDVQVSFGDSNGDDGAAVMRFDGLAFCIVRFLGLPLEDCYLRQIRVWRPADDSRQATVVSLMLETLKGGPDPRRVLVFSSSEHFRVDRLEFSISQAVLGEEYILLYMTPSRQYWYKLQD